MNPNVVKIITNNSISSLSFVDDKRFKMDDLTDKEMQRDVDCYKEVVNKSKHEDIAYASKNYIRILPVKEEEELLGRIEQPFEETKNKNIQNLNATSNDTFEEKTNGEYRFNHCSQCHDKYQFGNQSTEKIPYHGLKLGIKRYDNLFDIATFYTRNGFLNIAQVNELMTFLEDDYPDAEWNISRTRKKSNCDESKSDEATTTRTSPTASFTKNANDDTDYSDYYCDDSNDTDQRNIATDKNNDSTMLNLRFRHFYRYECALRARKISSCKAYITCLALFSKLKAVDKRHLVKDCSFYSNLFAENKDVLRYYVDVTNNDKEKANVLGDIKWDWEIIKHPIKFPHGPLLVSYYDKFDVPFYIATFYENYKYLTVQHLEFIFNSTIDSMKTTRFHIIRAMSKIRFDINSSETIHYFSRVERYLNDFIIRATRYVYHALLNNNILRFWDFVKIDKFTHYYLNFFDENLRVYNSDRYRNDYKIRAYVFSRIILYRFCQIKNLHDREVCKIKSFFHKWINDHLYQMAFPCSFFVARKEVWDSLNRLASRGVKCQESYFLDCITALRNLPSITCTAIRKNNSARCNLSINPPMHTHYDSIKSSVTSSNSTGAMFSGESPTTLLRSTAQKHSHECYYNSTIIVIDSRKYPTPIKNTTVNPNDEERYRFMSKTLVNLNAFHDFDNKYKLKNLETLKFWDMIDINWIGVDKVVIPNNPEEDTRKVYRVITRTIEQFLDTNDIPSGDVTFFINHREIQFTGDFKSLHFTNWQEYGFDNPTPFFRTPFNYVQRYFYSDIVKLLSTCLYK